MATRIAGVPTVPGWIRQGGKVSAVMGRMWVLAVLLTGLFAMHGVQPATGPAHTMPLTAAATPTSAPTTGHAAAGAFHARHARRVVDWDRLGIVGGHGGVMCLALLGLLMGLVMTRAPWLDIPRGRGRRLLWPRGGGESRTRGPPVYLRVCVFRR